MSSITRKVIYAVAINRNVHQNNAIPQKRGKKSQFSAVYIYIGNTCWGYVNWTYNIISASQVSSRTPTIISGDSHIVSFSDNCLLDRIWDGRKTFIITCISDYFNARRKITTRSQVAVRHVRYGHTELQLMLLLYASESDLQQHPWCRQKKKKKKKFGSTLSTSSTSSSTSMSSS
jgi:hypothetical protein